MIVLDTTVLSYAVGMEHPLREPCRRLLQAHGEGRIEATTTIEVIQEFSHVCARRRPRPDAVALARRYMAAFALLATSAEDLDLGLTLYERTPALGAFDAVLAAVALTQRVDALVSADRAFGEVPQLRWIDPGAPALDGLLGRWVMLPRTPRQRAQRAQRVRAQRAGAEHAVPRRGRRPNRPSPPDSSGAPACAARALDPPSMGGGESPSRWRA